MSINKAVISGNLGKDAELKFTPQQMAVVQFSVAVNKRVKSGDGYADRTDWINCVMFRERAERLAPSLKKGTKVAIEGHLSVSSWQDIDTGKMRSKTEVIVDNIDFIAPRSNQPQPQPQQPTQPKPQQPTQAEMAYAAYANEDIPF